MDFGVILFCRAHWDAGIIVYLVAIRYLQLVQLFERVLFDRQ